jgi:SAM-dependent methyltransferase
MENRAYVLGHSALELERLAHVQSLVDPITRDFFQAAGIAPGMRVLDVGSGPGAVTFLASELVGSSGQVLGIDLAPEAVEAACEAASGRAFRHVSFRQGNPAEMTFEEPFDAIVGRYVLWCQADLGVMLRALAKHLRPGGVIVFHEPDWSFVRSEPAIARYDRCCQWVIEAFERAGTSCMNIFPRLHRGFVSAGLPSPIMSMRTHIGDAASAADWIRAMAELFVVLAPTLEQQGARIAAEVGGDTLTRGLIEEVAAGGGIVLGRSEIGAWVRVQA